MSRAFSNTKSVILVLGAAILLLSPPLYASSIYVQDNLTSDGIVPAANTDPNLKNPWGFAFSPTSPFWISDQASGLSTLYNGAGVANSLVVTIPGGSTPPSGPTGDVFNSGPAGSFEVGGAKSTFLFDTLAGQIEGWNSAAGTTAQVAATSAGAVFTGLAMGAVGPASYLYAADTAGGGGINVYDSNFNSVSATTFAGKFTDPNAIAGFVPFNVQNIGGNLYVEYASLTATGSPLPGGYIDEFDSSGNFLQRFATGGVLDAPWGVTLAPATGFGTYSGDLLVGNFGNGMINAYSPVTGIYQGTLDDASGNPIVNPFLWALDFGNGGAGYSSTTLYFDAGLNDQQDGLFGSISVTSAPEVGTGFMAGVGLLIVALAQSLRQARKGHKPAPQTRLLT